MGNSRTVIADETDGDTINAGTGYNVVFGDNGQITSADADAPQFGTQPITLGLLTTIAPNIGGHDTINTGLDSDIILGGVGDDNIVANINETSAELDDNNIILGDNGYIDFTIGDRDETDPVGDIDPSDIDRISTAYPNNGGIDDIITGAGNDFILGGTAGDTIHSGSGNDLVFGDHGLIEGDVDADLLPLSMPLNTHPFWFRAIDTQGSHDGGDDLIYGEDDEDIILGQQGNDTIYGGSEDDDIIDGHNVVGGHDGDDRIDGGSGDDVIAGDNAVILRTGDVLSPRMRVLGGTVIYDSDDIPQMTADYQNNPDGVEVRYIWLLDHNASIEAGAPELRCTGTVWQRLHRGRTG